MFPTSFVLRQILASVNRTLGREQLPPVETWWPHHFENVDAIGGVRRELFHRCKRTGTLIAWKGYAAPVPIEDRVGVCAHITAVAFGTTPKARAFWRKAIESGIVPADVASTYGDDVEAQARRMALHARFWRVPYHWVGLLNGDVLRNNGIERYTFHGGGSNARYLGVAAEADMPGLEADRRPKHHGLTTHNVETWRAALRLGVLDGRERGAPLAELTAHRVFEDGRIGDPGEGWWSEVGRPVAAELDLDVDLRADRGGRPIPFPWEPEGLFDYRGRPIPTR